MPLAADTYVASIRADAGKVVAAIGQGPLDAPVPGCPGWDLRALTGHLGGVHRWARTAIETAAQPTPEALAALGTAAPDATPGELADWFAAGAAAIADALATTDAAAPTWHPFPADQVVGVWLRRQAQEISVHRVDAQGAVGTPEPIDPALAADGIDEWFEVTHRRAVTREQGKGTEVALPQGSLHVHCTDTAGEWLAWYDADGAYHFSREHAKGDAALRGPAEQVLLAIFHRPHEAAALEVVGDPAVLESWLAAPGL